MTVTKKILRQLRDFESRNITFLDPDGSWPIVWERAKGVHVWDAEGKKYLDLTAAFGVAAAGHANPNVVRAGQKQMAKLLHAMGDVHPHALKAQLARELSRLTFERWNKSLNHYTVKSSPQKAIQRFNDSTIHAKTIFSNSGFEAVESALKTAMLATGKHGVIAFEGAYHGLGYGALNATHREHFRSPFQSQLRKFGSFVKFPAERAQLAEIEKLIRQIFRREKIGAILVEPIQARGGINIPPKEFLPLLRRLCDEYGALLILDEIYTGFGRTGKWFACEHSGVIPDVICLGKALTGGFPLSACVGRADLMDAAWPASTGEAIHTSTFLGHPVGCAMALAQISEIRRLKLCERSEMLGKFLLNELCLIGNSVRGLGLMVGVELILPNGKPATELALNAIKTLLHRGYVFLPEGEHGNIISFTPPLTITKAQLAKAVGALKKSFSPMTLTEMRSLLVKRDIQLTRSLGQNFLHDGNQLRRIVAAAEIQPNDKVLEIGPGLGPLTELLVEKAGEVLAIEMDARLVEFLCERFGLETKEGMPSLTPALSPEERENVLDTPVDPMTSDSSQRGNENPPLLGQRVGVREDKPSEDKNSPDNLFLIHDDALAYIKREQRDWHDWKLVANLPYSVASPILVELAAGPRAPKMIVATLQMEVAKRLMAQADDDDYGILTLLVQIDFEPRGSFKIPPECFFPSPDVDSACVCLVRRATPLLPENLRPAFVKIVKRGFSQRRKMMMKLLKQDWAADKLAAAFAELSISPQERAEKLSLEQFVALTKILFSHGLNTDL